VRAEQNRTRTFSKRRQGVRRIAHTFVALFGVTLALGTPAMSAGNQGSRSVSAGSPIVITVKGRGVFGEANGTFTLIGASGVAPNVTLVTVSDSGSSHVIGNTISHKFVLGEQVFKGRSEGAGDLHGKNGGLSLGWSGWFVPVNRSTFVTTGTWRIRRGTGIYKKWKGGGRFISVDRHTPPANHQTPGGVGSYEARWEGLVTR
jgi:hypothetical protein